MGSAATTLRGRSKVTPIAKDDSAVTFSAGAEESEVKALRERVAELEREREVYKKELALIYALDNIRDEHTEPAAMFEAIVALVVAEFTADLCLLYLFDRESGELELWGDHPKDRTDIARRIRDPSPLFEFIDNPKYQANVEADSSDGVKINLLAVLPPHLLKEPSKPKHSLIPINHQEQPRRSSIRAYVKMNVAAMSIIMHEKRMGLLIIARHAPFSAVDIRLLKTAESQIDSAVVQAHNTIDFTLSNKELDVIYRVDHIRDENPSLEQLLEGCVQQISDIINADMTFMLLYKVMEGKLALQAASSDELRHAAYQSYLENLGHEALNAKSIVWHNEEHLEEKNILDANGGGVVPISAGMCIPLILQSQIIGVFGAINTTSKSPFLLAHRRLLKAVASQMDNAIYDSLESFRLRQVLGRSVDRKVLERLLLNPNVELLKPERSVCTVLFADIRGSTHLAEHTPAELLGRYINDFLSEMSQVIISYEGTLDKFIGDEVMAIFNAPFPQPDHSLRAVQVGLAMQEQHQKVMAKWKAAGVDTTPIGVGIATGELIAGEYGCALRTDYTVIGRAANLGARITGLAEGNTVLCSAETHDQIKDWVDAEPIDAEFKGIGAVTVYKILRIKAEFIIKKSFEEKAHM